MFYSTEVRVLACQVTRTNMPNYMCLPTKVHVVTCQNKIVNITKLHVHAKPHVTTHQITRVNGPITCLHTKVHESGSSVGIATGYGLADPGIESQWRRDFPRLSRLVLGHTQSPVQWVPGLSRG
jgi:hypothetical protein